MFFFFVTDQPEIFIHPKNDTQEEGLSLTLYCNATGNPSPTISWTKNGNSLSDNKRIIFSGKNETLSIANLNRTDSGYYRCVTGNSLGNDTSRNAKVDVLCKYSLVPVFPNSECETLANVVACDVMMVLV